jgi:hypothetical protein
MIRKLTGRPNALSFGAVSQNKRSDCALMGGENSLITAIA